MTPPQLHLPTIKVSDIEILSDWDFENVKAIGDSIPGFRSSSSEYLSPPMCFPLSNWPLLRIIQTCPFGSGNIGQRN